MHFNKLVISLFLATLPTGFVQAEKFEKKIDFTTEVTGSALEISAQWPTKPVSLSSDNAFTTYTLPIRIKSPNSDVYVSVGGTLVLQSASRKVQLEAHINESIALSGHPQIVHHKSKDEKTYNLKISTFDPFKPYPGAYTGTVTLIFEA